MDEFISRTQLLIKEDGVQKLKNAHVIVFGLGGVGGYTAESLVRCGIGELSVVDNDVITKSNLNRQILALNSTVGKKKTDVFYERALDINPDIKIHKFDTFVLPENISTFDFSQYDYIIDCIDTVSTKISIIENAPKNKIITCLGTGNKLNPGLFKISTIEKTRVCPLAKVMRYELKKRGISGIKCLYSEEEPLKITAESSNGRHSPGSISFVPPVAGLLIASEVIKDLISLN